MKDKLVLAIVFLMILPVLTACQSTGYHDAMQGVQDRVDWIRNANNKIEQGQLP